jgi:hypothetical protein
MQTMLCERAKHCDNDNCQALGDLEVDDASWKIYQQANGVVTSNDSGILYDCPTRGEKVVLSRVNTEKTGVCESIW